VGTLRPHQTAALADLYARMQMRWQEVQAVVAAPGADWGQRLQTALSNMGELWILPCRSGKTRAALTALYHWDEWCQSWGVPDDWHRAPHLVLAPSELVRDGAWGQDWAAVCPPWDPRSKISGPHERATAGLYLVPTEDNLDNVVPLPGSIVVATYPTLSHRQPFFDRDWNLVVSDEIHRLKNPSADWTQAAYKLRSFARLGLSATPFTNYVHELRHVLAWLQGWTVGNRRLSATWPNQQHWEDRFCSYVFTRGKNGFRRIPAGAKNPDFLYHLLRAEVMYSAPQQAISDAPEPIFRPIAVPLSTKQEEIYRQLEGGMVRWLNGHGQVDEHDVGPQLAQILYLMEVCADARLLEISITKRRGNDNILSHADIQPLFSRDWNVEDSNSKLKALKWVLDNNPGQVLVLTGFAQLARTLARELGGEAITGASTDRQGTVSRFKSGETRLVFCTKAAWEGITLAAPVVVLYGFVDYTPGLVKQAIRRAWTMFDTEPVMVYDLYAAGTVEDWNRQRLANKDAATAVLTNGVELPMFRRDS